MWRPQINLGRHGRNWKQATEMITAKRLARATRAALLVLGLAIPSLPATAEREPTGDPETERAAIRAKLYKAFVICEHWGGEEPYDDRRAAEIRRGFERDCITAFLRARHALKTMPDDPLVAAIAVDLESYAGPAFPDERLAADEAIKEKLCATAARQHAKPAGGRPRFRGYFDEFCPAQAAGLPPG